LSRLVLDASIAMAWCFPDEDHPYPRGVLRMLRQADAVVPAIWPLEIANALAVAERRNRLKPAESARFLLLVRGLGVVVDPQTASLAFSETLALARRHALSVYDAAYLELAMREGLPLATLDDAMERAGRKLGVARVIP